MPYPSRDQIHLKVVGVGGAGCNAIQRMAKNGIKEAATDTNCFGETSTY